MKGILPVSGRMLIAFGAACLLLTGCGDKSPEKVVNDQRGMGQTRLNETHSAVNQQELARLNKSSLGTVAGATDANPRPSASPMYLDSSANGGSLSYTPQKSSSAGPEFILGGLMMGGAALLSGKIDPQNIGIDGEDDQTQQNQAQQQNSDNRTNTSSRTIIADEEIFASPLRRSVVDETCETTGYATNASLGRDAARITEAAQQRADAAASGSRSASSEQQSDGSNQESNKGGGR